MSTASWSDSQGRTWSTAVNVNTVKRVKDLVGVNLLEVFDGKLISKLAEDPVLLVDTLYAVCKPQADELNVSDEDFGALLVGDVITEAAAALVQGIADFFPQDRRAVLNRLWAATNKARSEAVKLATSKLDSARVAKAMDVAIRRSSAEIDQRIDAMLTESGNPSGNLPGRSASTPAP